MYVRLLALRYEFELCLQNLESSEEKLNTVADQLVAQTQETQRVSASNSQALLVVNLCFADLTRISHICLGKFG
jgi:hypothetical protein